MTNRSTGQLLMASVVFAASYPSTVQGQSAPVTASTWTFQGVAAIEWLRFLRAGPLVVSSDSCLLALDPATGTVRWRRDDLGNVSQEKYEAAQASAPLAAGVAATPVAGVRAIRLMEEIPGGRLVAILADSGGRSSWFDVLDLETGATVWSSTALPIGEAHGFLPFPDSTTLLVHGSVIEPGRNRRVWMRLDAATGRPLWSTDSLLLQPAAQFDASTMLASRGTIDGNQSLVTLPDSTVGLYASTDGLVRFEVRTGRVRWRTPMQNAELAPIGQGYAPLVVRGDTGYLPAGNSVDAIELSSGRHLWSSGELPTMPVQVAATAQGLLIRGQGIPPAQDPQTARSFVALLDPMSGKARWKKLFDRRKGTTPFVEDSEGVFIASDEGLSRLSLASGVEAPLTSDKLPGRPVLSLDVLPDAILIGGSQSLTLVGRDGVQRYQKEFPAPSLGLGGRLLRIALGGIALAGGAYSSGGYLTGSAFARYQFSTSRYSSTYAYFVLKDLNGTGPALVKIEKASGDIVAAISLEGDKTPEYLIEGTTGMVVLKVNQKLSAYRW